MKKTEQEKGFTLLELLIVVAIIGIVGGVMIVVVNPIELLKKSRDSRRVGDLTSLQSAINFYLVNYPNPSLDNSAQDHCTNYIYFSTTEACSICPSDRICTCPSSTASSTAIDGTGWLPVNLLSIQEGSPISNLPLDPKNRGNYYYTYTCRDSSLAYEINARFESNYYSSTTDLDGKDGGDAPDLYEVGTFPGLRLLGGTIEGFYRSSISTSTFDKLNGKETAGGDSEVGLASLRDNSSIAAVFYNSSDGVGSAQVGRISGRKMSYGEINNFTNYDIGTKVEVVSLNSNKIVIAFQNYSSPKSGKVIAGEINGTTISFGTEAIFISTTTYYFSLTNLDENHFVVAYSYDGCHNGEVKVGTVSGTNISLSQPYYFATTTGFMAIRNIKTDSLSSKKIVIVYKNTSDSGLGFAKVGEVDQNYHLSFGQAYSFYGSSTQGTYVNNLSLVALGSKKFFVTFTAYNGSYYDGRVNVGTVLGSSTVVFGQEVMLNATRTTDVHSSKIDQTHIVIGYKNQALNQVEVKIATISATSTIGFGTKIIVNSPPPVYEFNVATINEDYFIIGLDHQTVGSPGLGVFSIVATTGK